MKPEIKWKSTLVLLGGVCAAAAGWLVWGQKRTAKVNDLARQLEEAWDNDNVSS